VAVVPRATSRPDPDTAKIAKRERTPEPPTVAVVPPPRRDVPVFGDDVTVARPSPPPRAAVAMDDDEDTEDTDLGALRNDDLTRTNVRLPPRRPTNR
jgi:hypothetical protein